MFAPCVRYRVMEIIPARLRVLPLVRRPSIYHQLSPISTVIFHFPSSCYTSFLSFSWSFQLPIPLKFSSFHLSNTDKTYQQNSGHTTQKSLLWLCCPPHYWRFWHPPCPMFLERSLIGTSATISRECFSCSNLVAFFVKISDVLSSDRTNTSSIMVPCTSRT